MPAINMFRFEQMKLSLQKSRMKEALEATHMTQLIVHDEKKGFASIYQNARIYANTHGSCSTQL